MRACSWCVHAAGACVQLLRACSWCVRAALACMQLVLCRLAAVLAARGTRASRENILRCATLTTLASPRLSAPQVRSPFQKFLDRVQLRTIYVLDHNISLAAVFLMTFWALFADDVMVSAASRAGSRLQQGTRERAGGGEGVGREAGGGWICMRLGASCPCGYGQGGAGWLWSRGVAYVHMRYARRR